MKKKPLYINKKLLLLFCLLLKNIHVFLVVIPLTFHKGFKIIFEKEIHQNVG